MSTVTLNADHNLAWELFFALRERAKTLAQRIRWDGRGTFNREANISTLRSIAAVKRRILEDIQK